jgi:hypothetical protein
MKTIAAIAILALTLAPAASAQTASFTGKWEGTLTRVNADGTAGTPNPMQMTLTQKGKVLTGTAGPNAETQWTVEKGIVTGNKATFEVTQTSNGVLHKFSITLAKDKFAGDIVSELNGQIRNGKVEATKAK